MKYLAFIILIIFCSCNKRGKTLFEVSDFNAIANYGSEKDSTVLIKTDLNGSVLRGIEIPSPSQTASGFFTYTFKIKNTSNKPQVYTYKLIYQNESYKFPEDHEFAGENFYGSWEDAQLKCKTTPNIEPGEVYEGLDSFKILGNPRNEERFLGGDMEKFLLTDSLLKVQTDFIRSEASWMKGIKEKANKEKISIEEQIYVDAIWAINYSLQNAKKFNNRWKRNPRMGMYQFYLVVTDTGSFAQIPNEYLDISSHDSNYVFQNPLSYFLSEKILESKWITTICSRKKLKVSSQIELEKGVYVNRLKFKKSSIQISTASPLCGTSVELYKNAQVEQYFHDINKDFPLRNIPELGDVVGDNMSVAQYRDLEKKYASKDRMVTTYVNSSDCPCKTVQYDSIRKSVKMINPGNTELPFRKEHVGIRTRIGFTYGKFIAKVKLPALISKQNVWNGLTNAIWLLVQEGDAEWNKRRICKSEHGYLEKYLPDNESAMSQSKKQICYSEIDFEILKESQFWPKTSYNSNVPFQSEDASANNDIMVTCTNWDMACQDPKDFMQGAKKFELEGGSYVWQRWNDWYKAITSKIPQNHDELFNSDYYYFEIDWLPDRIIWKVGPEKNKLKTICALSENVSAIPSNQMLLLFTQEWHNQEWWPTAPFKQNFIPFPKKDIIGEVMEIQIE